MNQISKAQQAVAKVNVKPMSAEVAEVRKNINIIQEAMQATFKKDTHYGVIPGCGKPSLYKAGAETLIALFKLVFKPEAMPVEQKEGEVRYLIRMDLSTRDGVFIGSGIGECSSGEEKYMWRKAVSDKEWENTPETLRRIKYKATYEINQVRVPAADMANTILKMAKKRALIDAVLTATAASDIFTQDVQDLPEGVLPEDAKDTPAEAQEAVSEQTEPETTQSQGEAEKEPRKREGRVITDKQGGRLYGIAMGAGIEKEAFKEWLLYNYEYGSTKDILMDDYEEICKAAEEYNAK